MDHRKITRAGEALCNLEKPVHSLQQFREIEKIATRFEMDTALALRLVQLGVVQAYHNKQTSCQPIHKAKPDVYEICFGKACQAKGAKKILAKLEEQAQANQDPSSKPLKIKTCSCLHRCGKAPVVRINGNLHEKFAIPE